MKILLRTALATWLSLAAAPITSHAAEKPPGIPDDYQLLYEQDFKKPEALKDFAFTDPNAWQLAEKDGRSALELKQQSRYQPSVRSPVNIALVADKAFDEFIVDVELVQTGREYGHRDMCLFFGLQDPAHFYYSHIATKADDHAHNIFIVNNAPRTKIAKKTTDGVNWGLDVWHKVRLKRVPSTGLIEVYYDDLSKPLMVAEDKTFGPGYIGFGSFDDTGMIANIKVWGTKVNAKPTEFYKRAK